MIQLMITASNTIIAILFAELIGDLYGFIVSTMCIVIFGEIIPQAYGTKNGMSYGARMIYFAYFWLIATFIFNYPLGKALDFILKEDIGNILSESQMKKLFK